MRDIIGFKTLSLRMPVEMARTLEMIAEAENKAQVVVVREAIKHYIEARRADPKFQERLKANIEADIALLRSLELPE